MSEFLDDMPARSMRDTGATSVTVSGELVGRHRYTGRRICCKMINGDEINVPEARVFIRSTFYTGEGLAAVVRKPICEVIVGNIPRVRNSVGGLGLKVRLLRTRTRTHTLRTQTPKTRGLIFESSSSPFFFS